MRAPASFGTARSTPRGSRRRDGRRGRRSRKDWDRPTDTSLRRESADTTTRRGPLMVLAVLLQEEAPRASSTIVDMLVRASPLTWVVLAALLFLSVFSWWIIFSKAKIFREVRKQGDRFLEQIEKAQRLEDAYK